MQISRRASNPACCNTCGARWDTEECIECSACEKWYHRSRVPLTIDLYKEWSDPSLVFLCHTCAFRDRQYDAAAALQRLRVKHPCFRSECLLLKTYGVTPPPLTMNTMPGVQDATSVQILQLLAPATLEDHSPRSVVGDGNCFYRALSLGLYGTQDHHTLLRLLTALEIQENPKFYDSSRPDYVDLLKDDRLDRDNIRHLLRSTVTVNMYAGIQHALAASAAVGHGIALFYPPSTVNNYHNSAYTRKLYGRGVPRSKEVKCTVMWTMVVPIYSASKFSPNHFVILAPLAPNERATITVDLTTEAPGSMSYADVVKGHQGGLSSRPSTHSKPTGATGSKSKGPQQMPSSRQSTRSQPTGPKGSKKSKGPQQMPSSRQSTWSQPTGTKSKGPRSEKTSQPSGLKSKGPKRGPIPPTLISSQSSHWGSQPSSPVTTPQFVHGGSQPSSPVTTPQFVHGGSLPSSPVTTPQFVHGGSQPSSPVTTPQFVHGGSQPSSPVTTPQFVHGGSLPSSPVTTPQFVHGGSQPSSPVTTPQFVHGGSQPSSPVTTPQFVHGGSLPSSPVTTPQFVHGGSLPSSPVTTPQFVHGGSQHSSPNDSPSPTEDSAPCIAIGGEQLPLSRNGQEFMPLEMAILILKSDIEAVPMVPRGIKENVYFVIDNGENIERREQGKHSAFWDDCGVWESKSGTSPKHYYVKNKHNHYNRVYLKKGLYCTEKQVSKQVSYIPIEPQPDPADVLIVHRSYSSNKLSGQYKKKVTWLGNSDLRKIAIVEYKGQFLGRLPHGNAGSSRPYIRTEEAVMEEIREELGKNNKPRQVYNDLILKNPCTHVPRNTKQVQNVKYRQNRAERSEVPMRGLADNMFELHKLVHSHAFVQHIGTTKKHVPAVVLYTDEQIRDLQRFCCAESNFVTSILGVDKTYNLGELHVTLTVFKNLSVVRVHTEDHPLFVGPVLLRANSDFLTYAVLFDHLASLLHREDCQPLCGSDDEKAMRHAIKKAFPERNHILCTLHLKRNLQDYMRDKVGLNARTRKEVAEAVFGEKGILKADTEAVFQLKCQQVSTQCNNISATLGKYFANTLLPKLQAYFTSSLDANFPTDHLWTNNNSESINNILKILTDRTSQPLVNLVNKLYVEVQSQYKKVELAFTQTGDFKLMEQFQKYELAPERWAEKTNEQRNAFKKRFQSQKVLKNTQMLASSGGEFLMMHSTSKGRKPGQRKPRRRTART